jgi:hypothetical protein
VSAPAYLSSSLSTLSAVNQDEVSGSLSIRADLGMGTSSRSNEFRTESDSMKIGTEDDSPSTRRDSSTKMPPSRGSRLTRTPVVSLA